MPNRREIAMNIAWGKAKDEVLRENTAQAAGRPDGRVLSATSDNVICRAAPAEQTHSGSNLTGAK